MSRIPEIHVFSTWPFRTRGDLLGMALRSELWTVSRKWLAPLGQKAVREATATPSFLAESYTRWGYCLWYFHIFSPQYMVYCCGTPRETWKLSLKNQSFKLNHQDLPVPFYPLLKRSHRSTTLWFAARHLSPPIYDTFQDPSSGWCRAVEDNCAVLQRKRGWDW